MTIRKVRLNTNDLKVKIGICSNVMGLQLSDIQISIVEAIIKSYRPTGISLTGSTNEMIKSAVTGLNDSTFRVMVSRLKKQKVLISPDKGSSVFLHPMFVDLDKCDGLTIEFSGA